MSGRKRLRLRTTAFVSIGVALLAFGAVEARADESNASEAQRLFDRAKELADGGRWKEACVHLEKSFELEPNMTTEFRLADCCERIGRTASASIHYQAAATSAARAGEPTKERFAKERAARLESRFDRLVIMIAPTPAPAPAPAPGPASAPSAPSLPPPDLHVERDGRRVERSAWNQPIPIDPGEHTVHVWASEMSSYDQLVTSYGDGTTIRLRIPPLEPALPLRLGAGDATKPNAPAGSSSSVTLGGATGAPAQGSQKRTLSYLRPWGAAFAVTGIAALGTGTVLGVTAPDGDSACGGRCTSTVVLLSAGAAALLIGAVVFLASHAEQ